MMSRNSESGWKRRVSSAMMAGVVVAPLALGVSVMEGCKKKAPPPVVVAPPPPPVQKEPDPVDFKAIAQTLKADKRVAFAPGASTNKQDLAEAIITVADSLARGDDKKFGAKIDPAARADLNRLVASGAWAETTKKIEAVRLVRLTEGAEAATAETSSGSPDMKIFFEQAMKNAPQDIKDAIKADLGRDPTAADLPKVIEKGLELLNAKKDDGSITEEEKPALAMLERVNEELKKSAPAEKNDKPAAGDGSKFTVSLAIQEPGSAYVQTWIAVELNGGWVFKASPVALPPNQRRASDFDAIFSTGGDETAAEPAPSGGAAPSSGGSTPSGPSRGPARVGG